MKNKAKVVKGLKITVCVLLAAVVIVAGVLFFPLTGEKHVEVWGVGQTFELSQIQTVAKEREDFKILMFTDTQLWSNLSDNKACYEEMDALVEKTQPDLIVLPGDNVSAFASRFSLKNLIRHIDAYGIPWAPVYGNHDAEIPTNAKNWQGDCYMDSKYCLFQKGPSNLYGSGNYVVNITEDGAPVYTLFLMDNGEYTEYDDGSTGEVPMGYEQIAWYEWNVNGIADAAGRVVPSMVFTHFAQPEFREAIETLAVQNEDGSYTVPEELGFGKCAYLPGCAKVNSGFFDKCKELGSTKYLFCGHDHENNASITYEGITMTYGLKTGPSPAPWNGAEQTGGTLVTVTGSGENQAVSIEHIVITDNTAQ